MSTVSEALGLKVHFRLSQGGWNRRSGPVIRAVDGIDLTIEAGETVALVGESGCGKSTLGRALLRLEEPSAGVVRFEGHDLTGLSPELLRRQRAGMRMVFQDPYASLNPRMRIGEALAEPLRVHGLATGRAARHAVAEILEVVGLDPAVVARYPHEFSGGQRQRIAIARAVIGRPRFVVADEPLSALDISVQAQILDLFADLKARFALTYLFVSHDLAVVRHVADRVAVMYLGRIVELAEAETLFMRPAHPYTQALLGAVPTPDPARERARVVARLPGELPSPAAPPAGCRFHPRCPLVMPVCRTDDPALLHVDAGQTAACWLHRRAEAAAPSSLERLGLSHAHPHHQS
ncbi:ATP-binding cassette domain-containing protein [Lichenihabitans sp. Uapishka_5]|uniref:ABC transporter ATP-binding protein n=1 Tax=Lichenihabitans sp. Uapishka_5 TaxID=3037302 RepID=UPI0029E7D625|nr:oligopeptide/dipeptide ABC transporter ATP-binding protein [Lichenihabitans sp. Uapishka_5]MDX7951278.1 ATP-binding cassette domain-containing protein [Lichenihabitans sp. Uapishka_5]